MNSTSVVPVRKTGAAGCCARACTTAAAINNAANAHPRILWVMYLPLTVEQQLQSVQELVPRRHTLVYCDTVYPGNSPIQRAYPKVGLVPLLLPTPP